MSSKLKSTLLQATPIPGTASRLGEGPCWYPEEQVFYWVDIEGHSLRKFNPATGAVKDFLMPERVSAVVPMEGGNLLVALHNRICRYDPATGKFAELVCLLENPSIRLNEGKCDPQGRFWVGTMALDVRPGAAALYCINHDTQVRKVLQDLTISNGLAWSLDERTLYFIDSPTRTIQAFDFDAAKGDIKNSRAVVQVPEQEGMPDGMDIDVNGNLWVALHGSAAVVCYDPRSGEMLQRIEVPALNVTSCTFGGPDLDVLYITSAREWLTAEQLQKYPLSGSVFSARPGVKGRRVSCYKKRA